MIPRRPSAIVFLGPPGVGEGTYAKRVAKLLQAPHVVAGELIRREIAARTPLGVQFEATIAAGYLLPDDTAFRMVGARLAAPDVAEAGAVLDGYPRTVDQARRLDEVADVGLVVNLAMREDALVAKLLGRCACSNCGRGYNSATVHLLANCARGLPTVSLRPLLPPRGRCEECGCVRMERRADDTAATISNRLREYHKTCSPVEEHYRELEAAALGGGDGRGGRGGGPPLRVVDFEITAGIPETLPNLARAMLATGAVNVGDGSEALRGVR